MFFQQTNALFKARYSYTLTIPERMKLVSPWYFLMLITDLVTIAACCMILYLRFGVSR